MTRLMSFWTRPTVAAKKAVIAPMKVTTVSAVVRQLEQRRQPRHHEHAGGHHGRGVDQRRDRRRAFHRVRQPGVQQELRRLAHRAHEQQQADDGQRVEVPRQEMHASVPAMRRRVGEDRARSSTESNRTKTPKMPSAKPKSPTRLTTKALIAAALADGLLVPEADQQVGGEADAFPAEEHLHEVVGRHQHQHGEGEERQIGEEARPVRVVRHVADRIDVDERRDGGHHDQHHRGQRVDAQAPSRRRACRTWIQSQHRDAWSRLAEPTGRRDPGQDRAMTRSRGRSARAGAAMNSAAGDHASCRVVADAWRGRRRRSPPDRRGRQRISRR